ncbi:hypothetical protein BJ166DRAFT_99999 [Pestalotiopsis sp. NC0098]|nr:hypothetical protein BJ166DRAFT_99999 [Pestalotiopsis sp. NC0098]
MCSAVYACVIPRAMLDSHYSKHVDKIMFSRKGGQEELPVLLRWDVSDPCFYNSTENACLEWNLAYPMGFPSGLMQVDLVVFLVVLYVVVVVVVVCNGVSRLDGFLLKLIGVICVLYESAVVVPMAGTF